MTAGHRPISVIIRVAVPWLGALAIALAASRLGGPIAGIAGGLGTFVLALVASRLLSRHDRWAEGLSPWPTAWRHLLLGLLAWLVPCSVMIIIGAGVGWLRFTATPSPVLFGGLGLQLVVVLSLALGQELIFRSAIFGALAERIGGWSLIVVQGALFGAFLYLAGGAGDPLSAAFGVGVGVALGYLRAITGGVWAPIGLHLAYRLASQVVGTPELGVVEQAPDLLPAMLIVGPVPFAVALVISETLVRTLPALAPVRRPAPATSPGPRP